MSCRIAADLDRRLRSQRGGSKGTSKEDKAGDATHLFRHVRVDNYIINSTLGSVLLFATKARPKGLVFSSYLHARTLFDIRFRGTTVTRTAPPSNIGGDASIPPPILQTSSEESAGGEDHTTRDAKPPVRTASDLPGQGRGSRKGVVEEASTAPVSLPRGIKSLLSLQTEDVETVSGQGQGKQ